MIIECDTRQQKQLHITDWLDKQQIKWIRNKLYCGDYKRTDSTRIIIDTKKDLLEVCNNLARTNEHNRIKQEIERAKSIGCERFIFLIAEDYISKLSEVHNWRVPLNWKTKQPRTQVKPETLQKIMQTMADKYNIEFMFCRKEDMGENIVNLLGRKD